MNVKTITKRIQKKGYLSYRFILTGGMICSLALFILFSGCTGIPSIPGTAPQEEIHNPEYDQVFQNTGADYLDPTPEPTQTPPISNITDWDPYTILPLPQARLNHTSILKNETPYPRTILNTTFSGSVGLSGFAFGKELNITNGPFSITYTVYPNISSPLDVWTRLRVYDPWRNLVAEGGYNRGYPAQETQTMMIYREGRYYLTIEGDFVSVEYTIKTCDPAPVIAPTPVPVEEGPPWMDGEGPI